MLISFGNSSLSFIVNLLFIFRITPLNILLRDCGYFDLLLTIRASLTPAILFELFLHFLIASCPLLTFGSFPGLKFSEYFVQLFYFISNVADVFLKNSILLRLRIVVSCYFLLKTTMQMIGFHAIC